MSMSKTALVTGANAGIGLETARGLAEAGYRVLMTSRDPDRGKAALEDVRRTTGSDRLELLTLDLASLDSVREAAAEARERTDELDLLVNNAGLVLGERRTTKEGFEATLGVNHLGHFLFTHLLLDRLRAAPAARIVNLASDAHRQSKGLDFDDLMWERRPYSGMNAYCDSKLANILFTRRLAKELEGSGVVTHAVHPGVVNTRFAKDGDVGGFIGTVIKLAGPFLLTPKKGARTSLHVALSDDASEGSGRYWAKSRPSKPTRYGRDDEAADRLWDLSVDLVGLEATARQPRSAELSK